MIEFVTRSNWFCWKAQEKFQVEFRFCKAIGCSNVTLLATHSGKKKKMFKASNRDIKKRCLPVSKTTLKITERCRYLLKVTIQNHITMPICNQRSASVLLSSSTARNFNNSWPIYVIYEKWGIITELFHSWNIQNVSIFYFWKKQSQKWTNFSNVYLQRAAILVSQS